ncbi:hypothetical protein HDU79_001602, partial [Rhizoclosmatium sp. JEL0117]
GPSDYGCVHSISALAGVIAQIQLGSDPLVTTILFCSGDLLDTFKATLWTSAFTILALYWYSTGCTSSSLLVFFKSTGVALVLPSN